jgi:hypothetical protein
LFEVVALGFVCSALVDGLLLLAAFWSAFVPALWSGLVAAAPAALVEDPAMLLD